MDLDQITEIERICFPAAEAASKESIEKRLETFASHFLVMEQEGKLIGFINGMVTNQMTITDDLFEDASLHEETGEWQSVFGLDVLPEYRNQGHAASLMKALINQARQENRKGCILTCKEHLVHYYETFGYKCMGKSASVHGGAVWYDMTITF